MPEAALCPGAKGLIEHVIVFHVIATFMSLPSITLEETSLLRVKKTIGPLETVGHTLRRYHSNPGNCGK